MTSSLASVLVFGPNGQLGSRLRAHAPLRTIAVGRDQIDLEDPGQAIGRLIASAPVSAVVNASAWTQVDLAETEPERARAINATAPALMASACAERRIPFVHISTDYVFNGAKSGAWSETDAVGPLNQYGATKAEGERAVLDANPHSLVVRTSWVVSEHGSNFVKTMLRLADRPELNVVGDQRGVPTDADALASFILEAVDSMVGDPAPSRSGVLHFRNDGDAVSWAEFAKEIFVQAGGPSPLIVPISTRDYGAPAPRPANSELSIERLEKIWGHTPPMWKDGLARILRALRTAT